MSPTSARADANSGKDDDAPTRPVAVAVAIGVAGIGHAHWSSASTWGASKCTRCSASARSPVGSVSPKRIPPRDTGMTCPKRSTDLLMLWGVRAAQGVSSRESHGVLLVEDVEFLDRGARRHEQLDEHGWRKAEPSSAASHQDH